jgi:hypothetical protein
VHSSTASSYYRCRASNIPAFACAFVWVPKSRQRAALRELWLHFVHFPSGIVDFGCLHRWLRSHFKLVIRECNNCSKSKYNNSCNNNPYDYSNWGIPFRGTIGGWSERIELRGSRGRSEWQGSRRGRTWERRLLQSQCLALNAVRPLIEKCLKRTWSSKPSMQALV